MPDDHTVGLWHFNEDNNSQILGDSIGVTNGWLGGTTAIETTDPLWVTSTAPINTSDPQWVDGSMVKL